MQIDPIPERCPECGSVPTYLPRICAHCERPFIAAYNQLKIGRARYCGLYCAHEGRRKPLRPLWDRFIEKVQKTDTCWIWTGASQDNRYGYLHVRNSKNPNALAHRVSWELHFGPVPDGMNVCHRCDNTRCVQPDHLFLGTQSENITDMHRKGRWKRK
jgi:hypothetical protein